MRIIDILCPVSSDKIDENVTRTIAVYTILFTTTAIMVESFLIMLLLTVDFSVRAFTTGKASPLKFLAVHTAGMLEIKNKKLTDAAPKKFAALLGMTFSFLTALFMIMQLPVMAIIIASALVFCALLDGIFGYCLGCVIYTVVTSPVRKNS
jgi:hypothetical protein